MLRDLCLILIALLIAFYDSRFTFWRFSHISRRFRLRYLALIITLTAPRPASGKILLRRLMPWRDASLKRQIEALLLSPRNLLMRH